MLRKMLNVKIMHQIAWTVERIKAKTTIHVGYAASVLLQSELKNLGKNRIDRKTSETKSEKNYKSSKKLLWDEDYYFVAEFAVLCHIQRCPSSIQATWKCGYLYEYYEEKNFTPS